MRESLGIRPARPEDADAVADVYLAAFNSTYDFPLAHADAQVRAWIRDVLIPSGDTWVAAIDGAVVGMLAVRPGDLDQLYVAPGAQGRGVGSRLVEHAKALSPGGSASTRSRSTAGRDASTSGTASSRTASATARATRSGNLMCTTAGGPDGGSIGGRWPRM